jgi:hypothetical protein
VAFLTVPVFIFTEDIFYLLLMNIFELDLKYCYICISMVNNIKF